MVTLRNFAQPVQRTMCIRAKRVWERESMLGFINVSAHCQF